MDLFVMEMFSEALSDTSNSSEDEHIIKEPLTKITKMEDFVERTVQNYSEETFQKHFRMSRRIAYFIVNRFKESTFSQQNIAGCKKITSEKVILMTIWHLANTESFRQIADRFGISSSSAHRCLQRAINFVIAIKHEYIRWPTQAEAQRIAVQFKRRQNIGNIIGVIDGSHVKINKPKENQDSYINRKGYHSLLLQGVVNDKKIFIDVYCGEPGSLHDARLLRKSLLYSKACEHENELFYGKMFLLGDSAYPSLSWIVPPFKDNGNLSQDQKNFNFKHSSTRIIIENAYGLLKGRFRRLSRFENLDLQLISKCIMACCVLHNICILKSDCSKIEEYNDVDNEDTEIRQDCGRISIGGRREEVFNVMLHNEELG